MREKLQKDEKAMLHKLATSTKAHTDYRYHGSGSATDTALGKIAALADSHSELLLAILDEQREANDTQKELLAVFRQIADELTMIREQQPPARNKEPLLGPKKTGPA